MKCKPYSEITVEIRTQLKTVKITSNIFAVQHNDNRTDIFNHYHLPCHFSYKQSQNQTYQKVNGLEIKLEKKQMIHFFQLLLRNLFVSLNSFCYATSGLFEKFFDYHSLCIKSILRIPDLTNTGKAEQNLSHPNLI